MKREHSRKPEELYDIIEACSPGPYLELFARHSREAWCQWGNEVAEDGLETLTPESDTCADGVQLALLDARVTDKMRPGTRLQKLDGHHH